MSDELGDAVARAAIIPASVVPDGWQLTSLDLTHDRSGYRCHLVGEPIRVSSDSWLYGAHAEGYGLTWQDALAAAIKEAQS